MDDALQQFIDQGKVAGVVEVLSRYGQTCHAKGYGQANLTTYAGRFAHPFDLDDLEGGYHSFVAY